jgi:hypothetical protein
LLEAVKENPRDPLGLVERPKGTKRLSPAEIGLLEFLAKGAKRGRPRKAANRQVATEHQAAA